MINFYEKYRDTATGFEGVATARIEFANGCVRILLERLDKDGELQETYFDEQRLEPLESEPTKPQATSGGGSNPPSRSKRP